MTVDCGVIRWPRKIIRFSDQPGPPIAANLESAVTWNPSDKGANISLSNGNLDAAGGGGVWNSVRATVGHSSGKRYFEILMTVFTTHLIVGLADSSFVLSSFLGTSSNSIGLEDNGSNFASGWTIPNNGPSIGSPYVWMFAVDMGAGKVWVGTNGTFSGTVDVSGNWGAGLSGTAYPAVASLDSTAGRIRGTTASFSYTPPTGYLSWGTP